MKKTAYNKGYLMLLMAPILILAQMGYLENSDTPAKKRWWNAYGTSLVEEGASPEEAKVNANNMIVPPGTIVGRGPGGGYYFALGSMSLKNHPYGTLPGDENPADYWAQQASYNPDGITPSGVYQAFGMKPPPQAKQWDAMQKQQ